MLKFIAVMTLLLGVVCTPSAFAAPARAQASRTAKLPIAPDVAALSAERCEVPVIWWMRAGNQLLPKKCSPQRHEQGTLRVRAAIDRDRPMGLIVEWQILVRGKIKFRCTGPIALYYDSDNNTDRFFKWNVKPNQDLQAANLYVTVDGWSALEWDAASRCVK